MAIEINTKVSILETYGKKIGNLVLEDAKFFGRPNFSGIEDRFKDDRRKFTVLIPNDMADQLRLMGWNVKTTLPEPGTDQVELSHLKVMVDDNSEIYILMGEERERLTVATFPVIDRSRFENIDMEIRAWEYDPDEKPGQYSARLVQFVGVMRPSILDAKYGRLG